MIKYLLIFLLPFSLLNASKILSYNIYDRTDRSDVMITFDTPYNGVIKQNIGSSQITIKLSQASIESSKFKKSGSKFLHSIKIIPNSKQTKIIASVPEHTKLVASKTSDAYGLRLRFIGASTALKNTTKKISTAQDTPFSALPTKKTNDMSTSYYIVVTILIIGILILFVIKKRLLIKNSTNNKNNNTWLFQENTQQTPQTTQVKQNRDNNQISIRFQKAINSENSVVMLDFGDQGYLVLMGKSNILLDKFSGNKPTTQEDFESILQNRHQELESFLNEESIEPNRSKDALQSYNEKAAFMMYES